MGEAQRSRHFRKTPKIVPGLVVRNAELQVMLWGYRERNG